MNKELIVRNFLVFETNFSDDGIFDASGNPITPVGKLTIESIACALRNQDLIVTEPLQYKFYGWQFTIIYNKTQFWFLLQWVGPWLLISQARPSFREKMMFNDTRSKHIAMLHILHECLIHDERLTNMHWFTKKEYEIRPHRSGAGTPKTNGKQTKSNIKQ